MGIPASYCSCWRDCNDNIIEAKITPNNNIEFPDQLNHVQVSNRNNIKSKINEDTNSNPYKQSKLNILLTKQTLDTMTDELFSKFFYNETAVNKAIKIQSTFRCFSYKKKFLESIKENLINSNKNTINTFEKLYTNKSYTLLLPFIENHFDESIYKNNKKLKTECLIKKYIDDEDCLYKGEIDIDNNFNGYGELYLKSGKKYEGVFKNNKLNGQGKLYDINNTCYEGNFKDNILSGFGKITKVSDDNKKILYTGSIDNFKKSGFGKEVSNDYIYEGNFKNDMKNGQGKLIYTDGDNYEGEFKDDEITGSGHYIWANKHEYTGTFINGKMHGKGVYIWPDGSQYEGEYVNNIKEGNGLFKWKDGRTFKGPFTNGRPNGIGLLTFDGHTQECEFKKGKYFGNMRRRTKSKSTNTGEITGSNS